MAVEDRTLGAERSDPALIDKMVTLQKLYADLDRQSRCDASVPRAALTADQFYDDYFYPNRPVILEGLMDDWPARTKWTFSWLREKFGEHSVEVHGDRTADEEYEQHFSAGRRTVRFADFMTMLEDDTATNDSYIVGRNHLLSRPEFRCLLDDIKSPAGFLDASEMKPRHLSIWIGPRGTVTPLHHDRGSVFFGQVRGRKRFKLIAPFYLPSVYNLPGTCYSDVPLDRPLDLAKYPLMRNIPIVEAVLNPGDFLLIPVAWWHWVRAEDASVSVTFKNFLFRGERLAWDYR
jgi:Cupin-like domain